MLWHIVRFTYAHTTTEAERVEHEAQLTGLLDGVEVVRFVRVGRDVNDPGVTGVIVGLDDEAALAVYKDHPNHVPVAKRGVELSEDVERIDFLTDDPVDALTPRI